MNKKIFILFIISFVLSTSLAFAQEKKAAPTDYKLLEPIPQLLKQGSREFTNAKEFIPGLVKLTIAIAGALAVVMIIWGGLQYIMTETFPGKMDAKGTITNAIGGLILVIAAWVILNTLNPALVKFDLTLPPVKEAPSFEGAGSGFRAGGATFTSCDNCETVAVNHKYPPEGCLSTGPGSTCTVQPWLNVKLKNLAKLQPTLYVTEAFPPTITHRNRCHNEGSCVDATIDSVTEERIKKFIEDADSVGLNAQFETTTEKRAQDIRRTGLPTTKVYYVSGIKGEHFSIYNK